MVGWGGCARTCACTVRTYVKCCAGVAYEAVVCDDVDEGQVVSDTTLVVIKVVGWSDFDST